MRFMLALALAALLVAGCRDASQPLEPTDVEVLTAAGRPRVVQVAPPVGDTAIDRASILAAAAQVREGGTILFAPGTYLIGNSTPGSYDYLHISVPRVTLLGHPAGTTIRGCDDPAEIGLGSCHGLLLTGGFQTVRNFTFEYLANAIVLGRRPFWDEVYVGGYLVEGNEFRFTYFGVSMIGAWSQPAIIRKNRFINSTAGVIVIGRTAHVVDNEITMPDPHLAPVFGQPFEGVGLWDAFGAACDHNLIARNRIDGHENGVLIDGSVPGLGCRHNVIRDNTITNIREFDPSYPSSGIALANFSGFYGPYEEGLVEDNLLQGNQINGSEGQGVLLYAVQRNRIVNNAISNVTRREQFPGWLGEGNGTGVWVSPQSRQNQILNNSFAAIASFEVVLEGDYNHVATRSRSDVVRDLGVGNRVTGPGSVIRFAAPAMQPFSAVPDAAEGGEAARTLRQRLGAEGW